MEALAVTVPRAAAILKLVLVLVLVLLLMDLRGMAAFRKSLGMTLVTLLASLGRVGAPIGALLFRRVDAPMAAGMAGLLTVLFMAQRRLFPPGGRQLNLADMDRMDSIRIAAPA